jgi:ribosomal protein S27AE
VARLVAATCPKCGAGVQLDPDNEWVTCGYCHVSSFIQTQKRRPTEEVVRMHQPVIHVQHRQSGCVPAFVALAVLGSIGASLAGTFLSLIPSFGAAAEINKIVQTAKAQATAQRQAAGTPAQPSIPEENLFNDSGRLRAKFEAALGGRVMLKELVLYDTYAIFSAQNPTNKDHVDRYTYRNGEVGDSDPVSLGSDKKNLDSILFPLDTIDFAMIPGLCERARTALKEVENGKISHIIIEKGSFGRGDPVIRVYISGERDSGYVEYSLKGQQKRVAGP